MTLFFEIVDETFLRRWTLFTVCCCGTEAGARGRHFGSSPEIILTSLHQHCHEKVFIEKREKAGRGKGEKEKQGAAKTHSILRRRQGSELGLLCLATARVTSLPVAV